MIPVQVRCRKPVYTINTVHTVTNNLKGALAQNDMTWFLWKLVSTTGWNNEKGNWLFISQFDFFPYNSEKTNARIVRICDITELQDRNVKFEKKSQNCLI